MANLPQINVLNGTFTVADAKNLQKHLIEKMFTSSKVLTDRIYETQESSLSFALDFYVKNKVGITNEEIARLSKMASHHQTMKPVFYIDYSTDYNDADEIMNLNGTNKNYVAQTYLTDDETPLVKRKYVSFIPIESAGININSTIDPEITIDVTLNFQSFRFGNVDTYKYKVEVTEIADWYKTNFTIPALFEFEYYDRTSDYFQKALINAAEMLDIMKDL